MFSSKVVAIQVGNREHGSILFIIPIIITIQGYTFEIYSMASDIHDNVDLVIGVKTYC